MRDLNCKFVKSKGARDLKRRAIKIIRQSVYTRTEAHAPYLSTHQSASVHFRKGDVMSLMEKYCRPQSVAMQSRVSVGVTSFPSFLQVDWDENDICLLCITDKYVK